MINLIHISIIYLRVLLFCMLFSCLSSVTICSFSLKGEKGLFSIHSLMLLCLSPFTDSPTSSPFPVVFCIFFCLILFIAFYSFLLGYFFSYHVNFSVSFIPNVSFFLPLNPFFYLFLIRGFPYILILHLFLPNIWCLPPSHSWWGPSSCSASEDMFTLTEMLFSHLALSPLALFTLQHRLSLTRCLAVSLPRVWILWFPHKWSWIFSTHDPLARNVGAFALLGASSFLGNRVLDKSGKKPFITKFPWWFIQSFKSSSFTALLSNVCLPRNYC